MWLVFRSLVGNMSLAKNLIDGMSLSLTTFFSIATTTCSNNLPDIRVPHLSCHREQYLRQNGRSIQSQ